MSTGYRISISESCAKKFRQLLFQDSGKTIHCAEKNDTSYKRAGFFTEIKKKNQNLENSKTHFPAPPILNIFSLKFHGLVLGLVELNDAKGIGTAQLIWL